MAATKAGPSRGSGPRTNATLTNFGLLWNTALPDPVALGARADRRHVEPVELLQVLAGHGLELAGDEQLLRLDAVVDQVAEGVGDRAQLPHGHLVDQRLLEGGDGHTARGPVGVLRHRDGEPLPRAVRRVAVVLP